MLGLGFDPKGVKDLRSLKLLEVIVGAAILAKESGFDLIDDRTEIVSRFEGGPLEPMTELKSGQLSDSKASKSTNQDERPISEIDRVGESHHLVDGQGGRLLSLDRW